jgi:hypothetical protein
MGIAYANQPPTPPLAHLPFTRSTANPEMNEMTTTKTTMDTKQHNREAWERSRAHRAKRNAQQMRRKAARIASHTPGLSTSPRPSKRATARAALNEELRAAGPTMGYDSRVRRAHVE